MTEPVAPRFLGALRALRDALTALGAPWMLIGGVAVIARGVARFTADLLLYGPSLDVARIRRIVGEFSDVLEDTARLEALEALLRRTRVVQ